jgi:hypothetical protein
MLLDDRQILLRKLAHLVIAVISLVGEHVRCLLVVLHHVLAKGTVELVTGKASKQDSFE